MNEMATRRAKGPPFLFWSAAGILLILDQISKLWAIHALRDAPPQSWLNDLFRLAYAENSGAFLSLGSQLPVWTRLAVMIGMNALLLSCLAWVLIRHRDLAWKWKLGWGLVLIGGIGNLIDRLVYQGLVIDFLNIGLGSLRTGIFNLADMYITAGICWLLLIGFREPSEERKSVDPSAESLPRQSTSLPVLTLLLTVGIMGFGEVDLLRADTVIYKAGARGGRVALNGEILEFNQREMVFRVKSPDTTHHLAQDQIVSFQAYFLPVHQQAEEAMAKQEYGRARELANQALSTEKRAWVRRELLALQIQAATNQREWATAAVHYKAMLDSDRATRNRDLIPLMWRQEPLSPQDLDFALRELSSDRPELRLITASWLLETPGTAQRAKEVLTELLRHPETDIRNLARCQLWRIRLREEDLNDGDLLRWERQLLELPESLQAGPSYLLAQGYERQVQPELAAARYLWIPIMDARHAALARDALMQAATLLDSVGQTDSAARLRREAIPRLGGESKE